MEKADIAENLAADASFNLAENATKIAGLTPLLKSPGPYTVFAPTNAAIAKALPNLINSKPADVKSVLEYHIVPGRYTPADLASMEGKNLMTSAGTPLSVSKRNGNIYLNATTKISPTPIVASNGIIYGIDGVLVSPARLQPANNVAPAPVTQPYNNMMWFWIILVALVILAFALIFIARKKK